MPAAGLSGKLEAFHAKPDKLVQRMSLPGIGDMEEGFDGTVGWSLSPLTGPTLLDGKQLEQRRFDAEFYEDLKSGDRYTSITTVEKTTFEGRPAYRIRLVKKAGDEDIEFYDTETGLKIGPVSTRGLTHGADAVHHDVERLPQVRQPAAAGHDEGQRDEHATGMSISSVEYGKVDPAVFSVPAPIKALVK